MDTDVVISGPIPPKRLDMFELERELVLPVTPSFLPNNVSVLHFEPNSTTYVCYTSKNSVQAIIFKRNYEDVRMETIPLKESGKDKPLTIMQCRFCTPTSRSFPVLVVATVTNVVVFEAEKFQILASTPIDNQEDIPEQSRNLMYKFARGITCVDNTIAIGSYTGALLLFTCTGENSFNVKPSSLEHNAPIADLATCAMDHITASADAMGHITIWAKNMKTVIKKLSTGHQVTVVNVLRKQVLLGNYFGQVIVYSIQSGSQLAELNIHSRQITSISITSESAYIMTCSEDCYIRVWKLHSRNPENYQVEYRFEDKTDHYMVVGGQFINARGTGYILAMFETNKLPIYSINSSSKREKEQ